jgi:purine-nucleoside phosphorylase
MGGSQGKGRSSGLLFIIILYRPTARFREVRCAGFCIKLPRNDALETASRMIETLSFEQLAHAALAAPPEIAIVLGSGLSELASRLEHASSVPFTEVAGLGASTVQGHRGSIVLGEWTGKRVVIFAGRLHYYEGHPWRSVTQPVQLAKFLGTKVLLLTNAAGGIHDALAAGNLMAIRDHIEWTRPRAWLHPGLGALGATRPSPYAARLCTLLEQAASAIGLSLHQGVYASVTGPCYETPAEIRALRKWGADAVGMSTAREIQVAHDLGLECAAVSCITNRAAGLSCTPLNHEEVLSTAAAQRDNLGALLENFLRLL